MKPSLVLPVKLFDKPSYYSRRRIHATRLLQVSLFKLFSNVRFPDYAHRNILSNMRITRSVTRKATAVGDSSGVTVAVEETVAVVVETKGKRKASSATKETVQKRLRANKSTSPRPADKEKKAPHTSSPAREHIEPIPTADGEELVPAVLTFSFEDAKAHLISADPRFGDIFNRVSCKPFEELERVDPFRYVKTDRRPCSLSVAKYGCSRTLAHSIL